MVIIKNIYVGNEFDLLNTLSSELIKRAEYSNLNINWILLSQNIIMINVFGLIQFITYAGVRGIVFSFTETFILQYNTEGNIMCYHHILNF